MLKTVFALPVSVEQIATAIKQMDQSEQYHLLELVPALQQLAVQRASRTFEEAQETVEQLRAEVFDVILHQPFSPDEPFLGHLTLAEYHALPDHEKARLWEKLADEDLMNLKEHEVQAHALSAG